MIDGTVLNASHAATAAVTRPGCASITSATTFSGPTSAPNTPAPTSRTATNASHADTPSA